VKTACLVTFLLSILISASGQEKSVTFYSHIEPIIRSNCVPCHSTGQSAPFNLITYEDVSKRGDFVAHVTKTGYMPPWKADRAFQEYKNERGLTPEEIETIQVWVKNGMPKGTASKQQRKATPSTSALLKPDLSLKMTTPYPIPITNQDDYRFFFMPTHLPEDRYLKKIEFIPGNKRLVHHSRLMTDTTHMVRGIEGMSANDPGISQFEKYPPLDKFLYGWVPGNSAIEFPAGTGKKIYKNTDIILNIHYAPNARENQYDQSVVNLYFAEGKTDREVFSLAIAEDHISNPPFLIKADEVKTFYSKYGPLPVDISVLGVLPHMHYLGKTFRAFAITPEGDAIQLIKIDSWDFKWQETYMFKKLLVIPKNSIILMEATFDNTAENPANPTSPPKDVTYGWNTTSEMLDMVLYFLMYEKGDENKMND
jgi:hypothetical protein